MLRHCEDQTGLGNSNEENLFLLITEAIAQRIRTRHQKKKKFADAYWVRYSTTMCYRILEFFAAFYKKMFNRMPNSVQQFRGKDFFKKQNKKNEMSIEK